MGRAFALHSAFRYDSFVVRFAVAVAGILIFSAPQRAAASELCQCPDACYLESQEEQIQSPAPIEPLLDLDCNSANFDNAIGVCDEAALDRSSTPLQHRDAQQPQRHAPPLCDGPMCQSMPPPIGSAGSHSLSGSQPLAVLTTDHPQDESSIRFFTKTSGRLQHGFWPRIDRPPRL